MLIRLIYCGALFIKHIKRDSFKYFSEKLELVNWIGVIIEGSIKQRDYIADFRKSKENLESNAQKIEAKMQANIPNIVLIIGESTQRNYMNIYGYGLENTPNLARLKNAKNLFIFSDTIAPHSHTNPALTKVLTFSDLPKAML